MENCRKSVNDLNLDNSVDSESENPVDCASKPCSLTFPVMPVSSKVNDEPVASVINASFKISNYMLN